MRVGSGREPSREVKGREGNPKEKIGSGNQAAVAMPGTRQILNIQPTDVKFPFELKKPISCTLCLENTTDNYIAFKVKTTSPKKYSVRPNTGLLPPRSSSNVLVTMQAQREAPPGMQCKDKFLVQSVLAPDGSTGEVVPQELFNKEAGNAVHEAKLRVLYATPQSGAPASLQPVAETSELDSSSEAASTAAPHPDHRLNYMNQQDIAAKEIDAESKAELKEPTTRAERATTPTAADSINNNDNNVEVERLQRELASMAAQLAEGTGSSSRGKPQDLQQRQGYSFAFVFIVGVFGLLLGYFAGPRGRV